MNRHGKKKKKRKLHKLYPTRASTFASSHECAPQHMLYYPVLKALYQPAKPTACLHFTHNRFYSVAEFVMTLTWFIRCLPFTFSLSWRGFVTFFFSDIFLNPHIDPSQNSENKFLWQGDKQLKYCPDSKKRKPSWSLSFCFPALGSVPWSEAF